MRYPNLNNSLSVLKLGKLSGGVNFSTAEYEIKDNQAPNMLNLIYDGKSLKKREGQEYLFDLGGEDKIISTYETDFYKHIIYHVKNRIVAYNLKTKERKVLKEGISEKCGSFFDYNGYVYYIGSGEYYKISFLKETEALSIEAVKGYIPIILINADFNGLGDENEPFNLLTNGFRVTYSTDETLKTLKIPNAPLIEQKGIKILYNNTPLENNLFSVNYKTGLVTFQETFAAGHNNMEITAYQQTAEDDRAKIINCDIAVSFGGVAAGLNEGTRLFVSGNSDYANTFFKSELKNPEYFPVNQFELIGDTLDSIVGFGKQYSSLVVFKERSIFIIEYQYDLDIPIFTISELNSSVGCDVKNSIRLIDNQLIWLNTKLGLCTLLSTNVKNEKNVFLISKNIDYKLLSEKNLKDSVCFDYKNRYYVVCESHTYVLNYALTPFWNMNEYVAPSTLSYFVFDNIDATCSLDIDGEVYLGGKNESFSFFSNVLYDFNIDTPINAFFQTKAFDFDKPDFFKTINSVTLSLRADNNSHFDINYIDEDGIFKKSDFYSVSRFSFKNFMFSKFTFFSNQFAVVLRRRVNRRRVKFFSLLIKNNEKNSQMAISNISVYFNIERGVRYNGY